MIYSPLRYPGGKNKLSGFLSKICIDNEIDGHYVEPYAGGASVALFLLLENFVKKVTINDKDRSIYAFWHSVLNETEKFCRLIENSELTVSEWIKQKEIQKDKDNADLLTLGFSTFYLNRTNRSGIIGGGVIGGMNQDGNYLIDCRFNKKNLVERINRISKRKESIFLYNLDAVELIDKIKEEAEDSNVIFYFDPPYYLKASSLYMNHYKFENHKNVSDKIQEIKNFHWIVSYDNVPEIQKLYSNCHKKEYSFKHTAYESRTGKEILFFSSDLIQPIIDNWDPIKFKLKKYQGGRKRIVYKG